MGSWFSKEVRVWYQLCDEQFAKYQEHNCNYVDITTNKVVGDLRAAIAEKDNLSLRATTLTVYKSPTADTEGQPVRLMEGTLIQDIRTADASPLLVVVPLRKRKRSSTAQHFNPEGALTISSSSFRLDGLDLSKFFLAREELVNRIIAACGIFPFLLVDSPAGTGKTSLLGLLTLKVPNHIRVWCTHDSSWLKILIEHGIDLQRQIVTISAIGPPLLLLLDDAQKAYLQEDAWGSLMKATFLPSRIRVIIFATHALSSKGDSPIAFRSITCRFSRDQMLLSAEESEALLKSEYGLPPYAHNYKPLLHAIIRDCGGHAAALFIAAQAICAKSWIACKEVDTLDEQTLLAIYYSSRLTDALERCFANEFSVPEGKFLELLQKCLFEKDPLNAADLSPTDLRHCKNLVKAGVLVGTTEFKFSTRMAERYFSRYLFPRRAYKNPASLKDLMINAVRLWSSSELMQSTRSDLSFPKEATFQHLLMRSLSELTRVDCYICPELTKTFDDKVIDGQVDFYLDGDLRWGITLLVEGRGVIEHLGRFEVGGKYFALKVNDYVVVDFRRNRGGNVCRHSRRITVLFSDDFQNCQYIHGDDDPLEVLLKA